jgi:hypothetical protein
MMPACLSAFLVMVVAALFALDVGRGVTLAQKLQTALDAMALSSMRIRAKGLESAAQAWSDVGAGVLSADANTATINSANWTSFEAKAASLVHALPGYKGRVRAVIGVVRDANGNILADGDSVVMVKELKVKGAPTPLKAGTKVKNIRLVDGDHDIDCKIDGIGPMKLKSEFVKKA